MEMVVRARHVYLSFETDIRSTCSAQNFETPCRPFLSVLSAVALRCTDKDLGVVSHRQARFGTNAPMRRSGANANRRLPL